MQITILHQILNIPYSCVLSCNIDQRAKERYTDETSHIYTGQLVSISFLGLIITGTGGASAMIIYLYN